MNDSQRKLLVIAASVSLIVHVAIALPVWNLPIGRSQAALFERRVAPESSVPVYRTPSEDALAERVDQPLAPQPLAVEAEGEQPEAVRRASREMLDRFDPTRLLTEDDKPVEPLGDVGESPRDDLPDELAEPAPAPARPIDATRPLLVGAEADLDLPRFVEPEDAVAAPSPSDEPIASADHLSIAALVKALRSDDPVGSGDAARPGDEDLGIVGGSADGVPGGVAGGTGTAAGIGQVGGRAGNSRPAEPLIPVNDLPPITEQLPEIDTPDDAKTTVHLDADFDYALRVYEGPVREKTGLFDSTVPREPGEPAWYQVQIRPKPSLRRLTPLRKDVVYVIDTSGSIESRWLKAVKAGVAASLDALNEGDRFNVVMFERNVKVLSPAGLVATDQAAVRAARQFIDAAEVAGYTDVNKALAGLVKRELPPGRVYQIIFISDGIPTAGAISAQRIIDVFTRENAGVAAIYAVAVGSKVNEPLLESLAYRNKGYVERPRNADAATGVIRELASRLRYPILKDATLQAAGVDTRTIYPRQPRDIHQHDPISLFGRFDDDKQLLMRVAGNAGAKRMAFTFKLDFADAERGGRDIAARWARAYTHHLMSEMLRRDPADAQRLKQRIDAIRKRYGID